MNKLFSLAVLLLVLAASLLSCKDDPFQLGLELPQKEKLLNARFTDTVTINSDVVMLDTVFTDLTTDSLLPFLDGSGYPDLLIGNIQDNRFGHTSAWAYSKVFIPRDTVRFVLRDRPAVFDSITFRIDIREIHGDSTVPQNISVYSLSQGPAVATRYTTKDELPTERLLGQAVFPRDVLIRGTDKSDRYINIKIDPEFGKFIFDKIGTKDFDYQDNFEKIFKGVKIMATGAKNGAMISVIPSTTSFLLHYRQKQNNGKDTLRSVSVYLTRSLSETRAIDAFFTHIESDLSGSAYLSALRPGNPLSMQATNNEAYIQEGTGIATRISFPFLKGLNKNRDSIFVNRASLSIEPYPENFPARYPFPPPSRIIFMYTDASGNPVWETNTRKATQRHLFGEQEQASSSRPYPMAAFVYRPGARTYTDVDITTYVQNLMNGSPGIANRDAVKGGLIMYSPNLNEGVRKVFFGGPNAPGAYRMRLKMYYTILNVKK